MASLYPLNHLPVTTALNINHLFEVSLATSSPRFEVRLHAGNLFGERALLTKETRAASVTAVTEVEVLVLSRGKFERLLGSMDDLQQSGAPRDLQRDLELLRKSQKYSGNIMMI